MGLVFTKVFGSRNYVFRLEPPGDGRGLHITHPAADDAKAVGIVQIHPNAPASMFEDAFKRCSTHEVSRLCSTRPLHPL